MTLLLASTSPRRRQLMALLDRPFHIAATRFEEPAPPLHPVDLRDYVRALALQKALGAEGAQAGDWAVGADTVVTVLPGARGVPLGKPTNEENAAAMLRTLSGRDHYVYTGVALVALPQHGEHALTRVEAVRTRVRFRELSESMISRYISTGEPMDKAGAYGAQGFAAPYIQEVEGDFFSVMGLPLCALAMMLEDMEKELSP
ncbi:MAG TPA: Maf family protein [Chthonomonadales bacterium]|nr:Maf family protein [Chthonomonadales bacterium]